MNKEDIKKLVRNVLAEVQLNTQFKTTDQVIDALADGKLTSQQAKKLIKQLGSLNLKSRY